MTGPVEGLPGRNEGRRTTPFQPYLISDENQLVIYSDLTPLGSRVGFILHGDLAS